MAKLHELLAVEGPLKAQSDKTRTDLSTTFEKRRTHFSEKIVTFKSSEEGVPDKREEQLDIQSTIRSELKWITGIWSKALNAAYQIAEANTVARADVVLDDGTVLMKGLPHSWNWKSAPWKFMRWSLASRTRPVQGFQTGRRQRSRHLQGA